VVWWLGHRLIAEREQACDEEVANMSIHRRSYAQALIKVCGFCLTPSRPYVAGVQSSELSRRITRILTPPSPVVPTWAARLLLVPAAAAVLAAPLAAGAMRPLQTPGTGAAAQEPSRPVYSPGPGITWPKLVKESKPNYTQSAMQAKLQGVLTLEAIVEADGAVKEARVVKSLDKQHGLDDQAIKAVKEWVFEPGTRDGKPVAVRVQIEMSFTLK
jgi:protein TonB